MILTSPDEAARQTAQVGKGLASAMDWDRVGTLYSFARGRAFERLHEAEQSSDVAARREHRQSILAIDAMYSQAQHGDAIVAACAITFFRARAMRDADHPEFLGEWLGAPAREPTVV